VFAKPSLRSYDRVFDAIRIRSGAFGVPAQVTIETATAADIARDG
jgi:hypothetical protein